MDIISFNEASTANGRIENFIENPDSTSGVLTVPKVIASGETITIPAGRVAILPDLQVDGDLVVDGDLFIPTGSMTSQVVQKVTSTDNAIVRFDGVTGQVQNSGVVIDDNDRLLVGNTPSGLNTLGQLIVNQPSSGGVNLALTNKTNDAYSYIYNDGTALKIINSYNSTAGYKPIILQTGGSNVFTLDVNGNVGIGVTPSAWASNVRVIQPGLASMYGVPNSSNCTIGANYYYNGTNSKYIIAGASTAYQQLNGVHAWLTAPYGAAEGNITFNTAMTLDASGNLGLAATPSTLWHSNTKVLQIKNASFGSNVTSQATIRANNIYDGTESRYITSGVPATAYDSVYGAYYWYTAPSGTAGSAINWTNAMTLDANGNLGIGTNSPNAKLHTRVSNSSAVVDGILIENFINENPSSGNGVSVGFNLNDNGNASTTRGRIGIINTFFGSKTDMLFHIFNSGLIEKMRLTSLGNLLLGTSTDNGVDKLQVNGSITDIDIYRPLSYGNSTLVIPSSGVLVANLSLLVRSNGITVRGLYEIHVSISGNGESGIWNSWHTFTLSIDANVGSVYYQCPSTFISANSTFLHRTVANPFQFYVAPESSGGSYRDLCLGIIGDNISRTVKVTIKRIATIV